jgi:hypothetical protein
VRVRRLRSPGTADRRADPSRLVGCRATPVGPRLPCQISCARLRLVCCGCTPRSYPARTASRLSGRHDGGVGRRVRPATPAPPGPDPGFSRSRQRRERRRLGGRRGRLGMRSPVVLSQRDTCLAGPGRRWCVYRSGIAAVTRKRRVRPSFGVSAGAAGVRLPPPPLHPAMAAGGFCSPGQLLVSSSAPGVRAAWPLPTRTSMRLACTSSALGTRICSTPSWAEASIASAMTWLGRVMERRKGP